MNKKENSTYPRIIQGGNQPAFEGLGTDDFTCSNCGNILAKKFDSRSLIAIDIQCRACRSVTRTASWPDNEVMPFNLVTLGSIGHFLLEKTVKLNERTSMSCDQEIARINAITGSRIAAQDAIMLSPEALDSLVDELNIYTNGDFKKNVARTLNAYKSGNTRFLDFPLAWAVVHLRAASDKNFIDLQGIDRVAIHYLQLYRNVTSRWKHHPLFASIVRAISSEFHHFITMLITASYLEDTGIRIGLTDIESAKGRSPDLYINTGLNDRLSIEVKAPKALSWPQDTHSVPDLERSIFGAVQSARGQITGSSGIVVIGASSLIPEFDVVFKKTIVNVLQHKRVSSRIEAVVSVVHVSSSSVEIDSGVSTISRFATHKNPRFNGVSVIGHSA